MAQDTNKAVYKLEEITDNPKYEGFAFEREESLRGKRRISFDFLPDDVQTKGRGWTGAIAPSPDIMRPF